jgi:Ankyrin repeats (3 copies)
MNQLSNEVKSSIEIRFHKYFMKSVKSKDPYIIYECVNLRKLEYLIYALREGCSFNSVCGFAAKTGQLEYLQYLHDNGYRWDKYLCANAVAYGHIECLRYLHKNGCPWDKWTCLNAAKNGQLECLRYLHVNGCPWDEDTCDMAARFGQIECLRYALQNGCPFNKSDCLMVPRYYEAIRALFDELGL